MVVEKTIPIYQVDAFTEEPFHGNPAGVCLLENSMAEETMQKIAMEMNLSETAFVSREGEGYRLRWFTPTVEMDLCGHATLASAHILYETKEADPKSVIRFFTRSGELNARKDGKWIELNFPQKPVIEDRDPPRELIEALGAKPLFCGKTAGNFYFFELDSAATVRGLKPDFNLMKKHAPHGVIVTSRSDVPATDFVSRVFAPAIGIDEDPVTGSAHCSLAPYWAGIFAKDELNAYQASARGGSLRVKLAGDRVFLCGQAVTVLSGMLRRVEK